jgi:acyl carrier protein
MSAQATTETVLEVVTDTLAGFGTEREQITPDATFEALDVDSLDLAELAQVVEERFGIQLRGTDVKDVKTVGDLVELIAARD